METSELVQAINALEGTDYDYVSPLPGGHQRGAHLIADTKGTKAVLKCSAHKAYLRQLERVSPILNAARIRGYPAPRYLRWGEVSDQVYLVYEYISGESLPGITSKTLPLILDLVDLQADLHLRTEQDWSKYAYDVVFNNESGWSEILRNQTEMTRQFMDEVDRTCKEFTGYFLPTDDLVHGDFGWENILWNGHEITGVIDFEYAGKGSRAIDLACLLEHSGRDNEALRQVLRDKIESLVGVPGLVILFSYRAMAMVEWFLRKGRTSVAEDRAAWARGVLTAMRRPNA